MRGTTPALRNFVVLGENDDDTNEGNGTEGEGKLNEGSGVWGSVERGVGVGRCWGMRR